MVENTAFPTPRDVHGQRFERRQRESHTKSATSRRKEDGDIAEQRAYMVQNTARSHTPASSLRLHLIHGGETALSLAGQ